MNFKELEDIIRRGHKFHMGGMEEKNKRVQDNLKAVQRKAKELKKPIPDELLVTIYVDQPRGSEFFKRFEEWLG